MVDSWAFVIQAHDRRAAYYFFKGRGWRVVCFFLFIEEKGRSSVARCADLSAHERKFVGILIFVRNCAESQ